MRLTTRLFATVLLAAALAPAGAAQPSAWTLLEGPQAAALRTAAVASDGTLLAGTWVTVLRNAGSGWSEVAGAMNGSIHDISTAPGGRVWAGTSGALRSDDGGQSWQWFSIRTAPHSGTNPAVIHIAQSPAGVVYAGGYRTTDGGASWPQMSIYAAATAFVGATAYAGTMDGVHRSTDGGASWTPSGLQGFGVAHMAATGTRLVAATGSGILTSEDGQTWTPTCTLPLVGGLAVSGDGAVWAAAPTGLFRSPDGLSWPFEPTAFAGRMVEDIAANGSTLLALVEGNPYRSADGGATWTAVPDGLGLPFASALLASDGVVAVATNGAGPFRSADGGVTWEPWPIEPGLVGVRRLLPHGMSGIVFAQTPNSVYRASLTGGTWEETALPDAAQPEGLASDGTVLLAVVSGPALDQTVYRSSDAGETWTVARTDSDVFGPQLAAGGGVGVVSAVGFVAAEIHITSDGGLTWISRPHPTTPAFGSSSALFVDSAGRVYVEDGNRLLRSDDLGESWTPLGPAGGPTNRVRSLDVAAGALCLGTLSGVWCSTDDGASFAPANAGLPGGTADIVALARDGSRYFALTNSDGVFASDATTAGAPAPTAGGVSLTVSPNPAAGDAEVAFGLPTARHAIVDVFDALGRRTTRLHDGPLTAGSHRLAMSARALPPGVYLIRLTAGPDVATRRLVLTR